MKSQDPDQQRNLLLAVVLSMAVLLGWQLFYAGPKMKEEQARQRAQQELTQKQGADPGCGQALDGSSGARRGCSGSRSGNAGPDRVARRLHQGVAAPRRSRRLLSKARSRCAAAASTTSYW